MTAGALYQLKLNRNAENNFLDFDPQITFFKVVYRKHTRFSMENIEFDPLTRQTLDFNESVIMQANVPRNGDLLKNVYLTFNLPDIYSGHYQSSDSNYYNYEFQWIKNIGINIFNYISIKISDQEIDRTYSDYYYIWKELTMNDEKKELLDEMVGNIADLYDPANGTGNNTTYPSITSGDTNSEVSSRWSNMDTANIINYSQKTNATYPSIKSRTIRVPLNFWFCNDVGLALPLIALQYSKVSFEIEMKAFRDLYTIKDVESNNVNSISKRIKPSDTSRYNMSNFTTNYNFNISPKLEGEYIFLDDEERRRFAVNDHDYLIKQTRITEPTGVIISSTKEETEVKLSAAFNPVSHLAWVIKRDDMSKVNEWNNYTNWIYPNIPPDSHQYSNQIDKYNFEGSSKLFYDENESTHRNFYKPSSFKKHILTKVRLEFDGTNRVNKTADYFKNQQIYQHFDIKPDDGIYIYSFSLKPYEYQPSGSCNFSSINNTKLYLSQDIIEGFTFYSHKAYVYIISYNILTITNGIGNMKFSN